MRAHGGLPVTAHKRQLTLVISDMDLTAVTRDHGAAAMREFASQLQRAFNAHLEI